jgi:hypothetical protein
VARTFSPTIGGYYYHFEIDGLRFTVSKEGWDVLDEQLTYRLYYTPRGKRLLNMEVVGEAEG